MLYVAYIVLALVLLIDLIFYVPIKIFFYISQKEVYLYIFTFPLIKLNDNEKINKLENKIRIDNILKTKKEDFKIIKTIKIEKLMINLDRNIANKYPYIYYFLLSINNYFDYLDYVITNENKLYLKVNIKIVNIIAQLIKTRRTKNERTSNK